MICLPENLELDKLIDNIRELSWEISNILRSYNQNSDNTEEFQRKLNITNFETGPVTSADLKISQLIKRRISEKYPLINWDFLSEEDKEDNLKKKLKSKWVWIIDPIDGTRDFIKQTGEYAVHIALRYQDSIIFGVVLIPSKEELWFSAYELGTWCENKEQKIDKMISSNEKDINKLVIVTSKSHMHSKFSLLLERLKPSSVIGMGSVGYKIVSILNGDADVYISFSIPGGSSPKDWDMAAPSSIIEKAGGFMTDIKGNKLNFLKPNFKQEGIILASMNKKHKEICKRISLIEDTL